MKAKSLQIGKAISAALFVLMLCAEGKANGKDSILTQKIYTSNENKKNNSFQQHFSDGTICPMPSFLEVYNITAHEATLIWENVGDLYDLELKEANDVEWQIIEIAGLNTIMIVDMIPNTTYNIRIRTICDPAYEVTSDWNTINFTTEPLSYQTITALQSGWNWFSTNVEITLDDLENALVEALPGTTINIKSQTQNAKYQNGRWTGSLTALDMTQMYMISVENDCEITLEGTPINPSTLTVTINNGANWIAFPYSESMTVTDFFGSFPVNNDMVKSQSQNARYQGNRWGGQLGTLVPGKGYMYISNTSGTRTFTFPTSAK